jgi:hypothetical protein
MTRRHAKRRRADLATRSQSFKREFQRQRCKKNYNATSSQVRFESKKVSSAFVKTHQPVTTLAL